MCDRDAEEEGHDGTDVGKGENQPESAQEGHEDREMRPALTASLRRPSHCMLVHQHPQTPVS